MNSTKLTKTFRTVNKVLLIIELVSAIIATVVLVACGIINLALAYVPEIVDTEAAFIAMITTGTMCLLFLLLTIPLIIYSAICLKQVKKPTHSQFLAVAIASFILGEYAVGGFSLAIYIIEGKEAKRNQNIID